jgi:hypothetical protein
MMHGAAWKCKVRHGQDTDAMPRPTATLTSWGLGNQHGPDHHDAHSGRAGGPDPLSGNTLDLAQGLYDAIEGRVAQ